MSSEQNIVYLVEVMDRAFADLDAIYEFIDAESCTAAWTWFNELEALIYSLDHLPHRGTRPAEDKALRQPFHRNKPHIYRVIYSVDDVAQRVKILHVRHGARDSFRREDLQ